MKAVGVPRNKGSASQDPTDHGSKSGQCRHSVIVSALNISRLSYHYSLNCM
jgi:hypothetical protein